MNDPRRLIDEGADGFERGLLDAASRDAGSDASLRRLHATLGVGAGVTAVTAAGKAAAASRLAAGTGKVASAAALSVAKWLGVGALCGAVVVGGVEVARQHAVDGTAKGSPAAQQAPARRAVASRPPAREQTAVEGEVPQLGAQIPEAAGERREAASGAAPARNEPRAAREAPAVIVPGASGEGATAVFDPPSPLPSAEESLREEVRLIDAARDALRRRAAAEALAAVARHDTAFPRGSLGVEASVLRVQALLLAGDRASAERLGRAIVARHPSGPYGARVRDLLEGRINP